MRPRARVSVASALVALSALLFAGAATAQTPPPPASTAKVWVMPGAAPTAPSPWVMPASLPPPADKAAPPATQPPRAAPPAPPAPPPAPPAVQSPPPQAPSNVPVRPASRAPSDVARTGNVAGVAIAPSPGSRAIGDYTFGPPPSAPEAEKPANEPKKPRETHFDLGIGTEAPISVGGLATLEVPHRILFQVGAGVMPKAYTEAIDGFLTQIGAYDAVVSTMVRGSMANSFVLRTSVGLRPFEGHGFEILGGYTLMTAGGSVATTDVLNAILVESGSSIQAPAGLGGDIPLSATLHNFHASLGWRWLLADDHLVIRASLSYLQTVASNIQVKIPESAAALVPYEGQINEQVNAYLGPYFSKYAKAPTLGLSAAFRF